MEVPTPERSYTKENDTQRDRKREERNREGILQTKEETFRLQEGEKERKEYCQIRP